MTAFRVLKLNELFATFIWLQGYSSYDRQPYFVHAFYDSCTVGGISMSADPTAFMHLSHGGVVGDRVQNLYSALPSRTWRTSQQCKLFIHNTDIYVVIGVGKCKMLLIKFCNQSFMLLCQIAYNGPVITVNGIDAMIVPVKQNPDRQITIISHGHVAALPCYFYISVYLCDVRNLKIWCCCSGHFIIP